METAFAAFTAFLIAALPLSVGVTKVVDTIRNATDPNDRFPKVTWNIAALVVGVLAALGFGFNLFVPLIAAIPALENSGLATGTLGEVATGLALGGMAGFWHEEMAKWSAQSKTGV